MNTFAVNGKYSGSVLRVDKKLIIDVDSSVMALRVLNDSHWRNSNNNNENNSKAKDV